MLGKLLFCIFIKFELLNFSPKIGLRSEKLTIEATPLNQVAWICMKTVDVGRPMVIAMITNIFAS